MFYGDVIIEQQSTIQWYHRLFISVFEGKGKPVQYGVASGMVDRNRGNM